MDVISQSESLPAADRDVVLALGTFDALHLEDQRIVEAAVKTAKAVGLPSAVLLFEPHPRRLMRPSDPPFNLANSDQRRRTFERLGVDRLYSTLYSGEIAALAPDAFVQVVVHDRLRASHICASSRILFGGGRAAEHLQFKEALKACYGDRGAFLEPELDDEGRAVDSGRIRGSLRSGDLEAATRMIGRPYAIEGPVLHGAKLGRTIGFPTINLSLGEYARPAQGIYASRTRLGPGPSRPGVSYIGQRPTVQGVEELLETFLFDWTEEIYGRVVETELIRLLRLDQTFASMEEMQAQIVIDCEQAREILKA